ncbi:MAG: DUF465 domain-containing protein [Pseudomonadota bacterium]
MSHTPHELADEFPEKLEQIHLLKISDPRFANLASDYHVVNREIHRIETDVTPTSDAYLEDLKKRRLGLLDTISPYLVN